MSTEHALPWGWTQDDVDREPLKAVLEHTYGNCPCDTPEKCLCAIAALVEPLVPQPTSCENKNACSLAGNEGHQDCTPDPVLMAIASRGGDNA